ncbi:MAG: hypothetical protein M3Q07_19530, partial [Pseudobdellovibrionaceae bacterium]|nr:hypothetical protein [Pseudobdellovibrionaceae bacterium]
LIKETVEQFVGKACVESAVFLDDQKKISVSLHENCEHEKVVGAKADGFSRILGWSVTQTLNYIFFYGGKFFDKDLTSPISEERIVGILAHELGHYYRAHDANKFLYNYFYPIIENSVGVPARAEKNSEHAALGEEFALIHDFLDFDFYEIYSSLISKHSDKIEEELGKMYGNAGRIHEGRHFDQESFMANLDIIRGKLESSYPPTDGELTAALEKINTIRDFFTSRQLTYTQMHQKATLIGLGIYTVETDADRLSSRFLSLLGVDPWAYLKEIYADAPEECRAKYDNTWSKGIFSLEVPGVYSFDSHGSPCFRIFNINSEIITSGYDQAQSKREIENVPGWQDEQQTRPWLDIITSLKENGLQQVAK